MAATTVKGMEMIMLHDVHESAVRTTVTSTDTWLRRYHWPVADRDLTDTHTPVLCMQSPPDPIRTEP